MSNDREEELVPVMMKRGYARTIAENSPDETLADACEKAVGPIPLNVGVATELLEMSRKGKVFPITEEECLILEEFIRWTRIEHAKFVGLSADVDDVCHEEVETMRLPDSQPIDAYEELTKAKDLLLAAINTPDIRKRMEADIADWLNRVRDSKGDVRPIKVSR